MNKEITVSRFIEIATLPTNDAEIDLMFARWKDSPDTTVNIGLVSSGLNFDYMEIDNDFRSPSQIIKYYIESLSNVRMFGMSGDWRGVFVKPEFSEEYRKYHSITQDMGELIINNMTWATLPDQEYDIVFLEESSLIAANKEGELLSKTVRSFISEDFHNVDLMRAEFSNPKVSIDWSDSFQMVGMGKCYPTLIDMNEVDYMNYHISADQTVLDKYIPEKFNKELVI